MPDLLRDAGKGYVQWTIRGGPSPTRKTMTAYLAAKLKWVDPEFWEMLDFSAKLRLLQNEYDRRTTMTDSLKLAVTLEYEYEPVNPKDADDYYSRPRKILIVPQHINLQRLTALGMDNAPPGKRGGFYKLFQITIDIDTPVEVVDS